MVDFDRKPSDKSAEERAFDVLNAAYTEKYGKPYVFDFAQEAMTWQETLEDIQRRIDRDDPQKPPQYIPDVDY